MYAYRLYSIGLCCPFYAPGPQTLCISWGDRDGMHTMEWDVVDDRCVLDEALIPAPVYAALVEQAQRWGITCEKAARRDAIALALKKGL